MRLTTLLVALLLAAPVWSQAKSTKAAPAKPAASQKPAPLPNQPPPGAEKTADGFFRWRDPSGDWWLYKQTPFGWSKAREKDLAAVQRADEKLPSLRVVAVKAGSEEITFERPTPFSSARWTKKKAELTAEETEALERWNSARLAESKSAPEKE
jgi:hypothetical protein